MFNIGDKVKVIDSDYLSTVSPPVDENDPIVGIVIKTNDHIDVLIRTNSIEDDFVEYFEPEGLALL